MLPIFYFYRITNQKLKITDSGTNGIFYGDEEFVQNSTNTGNSCAYDANGNRLYDSNSNIWGIRYNTLNLPDAMQFYQGHQTNYTYSATGAKLKVIDKTAPAGVVLPVTSLNTILLNPSVSTITTTDYVGNMVYENGTLKRILTPVGYWQAGTFYYFLKDHLGSNRVVINGSGGIAETSSYYPSGMRFGESAVNGGSVQPYRHTGHEMQEMHGLNWIDNGARFRTVNEGDGFLGVDPLAEKYYSISPYAYCAGNPINRIDTDGKKIIFLIYDQNGKNTNQLTYRNGNFWHENGSRYNPGKESLSRTLYRTLAAYREIEKSGDKVHINQLKTLENSKKVHFIEEGSNGNSVIPYEHGKTITETNEMVMKGIPVGSRTKFDFSSERKKILQDANKGIPFSDGDLVSHEMSHEFDNDQGQNTESDESSAKDPAEIRAINNENRIREREKEEKRTTYGGEEVNPNKLK